MRYQPAGSYRARHPLTGKIKGTPLEAARCIARNAEKDGNYAASVHPLTDGSIEVNVKSSAATYMTMMMWRIRGASTQASFEAWANPDYLPSHEGLMQKVRGDC